MKLFYLARGMSYESYATSFIVRGDDPWTCSSTTTILDRVVQGLLVGDAAVLAYFKLNQAPKSIESSWSLVVATNSPALKIQPGIEGIEVGPWYTFVPLPGSLVACTTLNHDVLDKWVPEPQLFQWCAARVWASPTFLQETSEFSSRIVAELGQRHHIPPGTVLWSRNSVTRWDQEDGVIRHGKIVVTWGDAMDALAVLSGTKLLTADFGFTVDCFPKSRRVLLAALMMLHGQVNDHGKNTTTSWDASFVAYHSLMHKVGKRTSDDNHDASQLWRRLYPAETKRDSLLWKMNVDVLDPLNATIPPRFRGWVDTTALVTFPFKSHYDEGSGNWSLVKKVE